MSPKLYHISPHDKVVRPCQGNCKYRSTLHATAENLREATDILMKIMETNGDIATMPTPVTKMKPAGSTAPKPSDVARISAPANRVVPKPSAVYMKPRRTESPYTQPEHYGSFKNGEVSVTDGQIKKHREQMTSAEIEHVLSSVRNLPRLRLSRHLKEKMESERLTIDPKMMGRLLRNPKVENLVEYNSTPDREGKRHGRVLLRTTETTTVTVKGRREVCNLCFVVQPDTKQIITAYWNRASDQHKTVDWSRYSDNLPVQF